MRAESLFLSSLYKKLFASHRYVKITQYMGIFRVGRGGGRWRGLQNQGVFTQKALNGARAVKQTASTKKKKET